LPLPVGAQMSVCRPAAIAGHPWAWGGVGSAKADENHARVGAANAASGSNEEDAGGAGFRGTGRPSLQRSGDFEQMVD
jgi:hypothetical protein